MKYAVVGIGAIGSIIGGLLIKSGAEVILIGKRNQVEIINQKGIKIIGLNGPINVKKVNATNDISIIKNVDVLIVCVKAQDTQNLADDIKKFINKKTLIVSLQNGVRNIDILNKITGNKVIAGTVLFNALYLEPQKVEITIKSDLLLESDNSSYNIVNHMSTSLNKVGLKTRIVEDIQGYNWSKLIVNLQNAVTSLTGQTIKESFLDKISREIIIKTMKEGINIAEKSGIALKTLPNIDPKKTIKRLSLLNSTLIKLGSRILKIKDNARTSMWQSIFRGKFTEIDFINGEIVTLSRINNLKAPINTKLVELVKEAEKAHKTKSFEPYELKMLLEI
jgi:2-dehydropantoate 2-reductase